MNLKRLLFFLLIFNVGITAKSQCTAGFTYVESSGTVTFTNTSTGNNINIWDFGDGTNSGTENPVHLYDTAGTYVVCLIISDFFFTCSDTICQNVVVTAGAPPCTANFNFVELNGLLTVHNTSTGVDTTSAFTTWDFGDGNNGFGNTTTNNYADTGTYNVCMIINDFGGCQDTICQLVTVDSVATILPCAANFSFTVLSDTVLFYNTSTGVDTTVATAYWDFGDGSFPGFGNTVNHVYGANGTYSVCLIINDFGSCQDTLCQDVTITALPPSACSASFSSSVSGGTVTLTSTSTGTSPTTIYMWVFTDGSLPSFGDPVVHNFASAGIQPVCLIINDFLTGCSDTSCNVVFILSGTGGCQADFDWSPSGNDVSFSDMSTYTEFTTLYTWDYGDGTNDVFLGTSNPTHTYDFGGTYNVCLTISDIVTACEDSICYSITVVGVNENDNSFSLKAYPNPIQNEMLNIESGAPIEQINILGMDGKIVQQVNGNLNNRIQLNTLFANGVYLIEVITPLGKQQLKLVKE